MEKLPVADVFRKNKSPRKTIIDPQLKLEKSRCIGYYIQTYYAAIKSDGIPP